MTASYVRLARLREVLNSVQALRAGARVGIIDRNGNGTDHGLAREIVVKEMGEAGYKLVAKYDFTKADGQDYFLIFVAR